MARTSLISGEGRLASADCPARTVTSVHRQPGVVISGWVGANRPARVEHPGRSVFLFCDQLDELAQLAFRILILAAPSHHAI